MKNSKVTHQKHLDQLWEILPKQCPMRISGREKYDAIWLDPDPFAMLSVDPTLKISYSPILAEIIIGTANDFQREVLHQYIDWLIRDGTLQENKSFTNDYLECLKNREKPRNKRLLLMVETLQYIESVELDEQNTVKSHCDGIRKPIVSYAAIQKIIRDRCKELYPEHFPKDMDSNLWKEDIRRLGIHILVPWAKGGGPEKSSKGSGSYQRKRCKKNPKDLP